MAPRKNRSNAADRHQKIVEEIRSLIRRDALKPGCRLPSERALALMFKASRNSVREAIRALIEKGVLRSRRGDGTYLADNDVNALVAGVTAAVHRRQQRVKEIFGFRHLIEPEIAARAAGHITVEDLDFLKITVFEQERCILNGEDDGRYDRAFHLRLAQATGNRVIKEVFEAIEGIVGESRSRRVQNVNRQRASLRAHIAIIGALAHGDGNQARQLMTAHLMEMEKAVLETDDRP